ncbi:uncharacterized protein LOC120076428 [Benincasa hispida]|uniref:uncharacterized protein LOC120076428 n=1 Tax=Benincasa hispida TaxID=102211 RepID=UPI0019003235|nr:uncharacterized protein LOC120076428 [Benincasa hispida]
MTVEISKSSALLCPLPIKIYHSNFKPSLQNSIFCSKTHMAISKLEMGFQKEEKSTKILRALKILFFLISIFISLLFFSAPILLAIADALLPSALLSAFLYPDSLSFKSLSSHLQNYRFASSLVDIPLISISRSAILICFYSLCNGPKLSRGPYLAAVMACSLVSLVFVSMKAWFVFGEIRIKGGAAMEMALFSCSLFLGVSHIVVAYRASCRERRKLRVYEIDIEAVSACHKGFLHYKKFSLEAKTVQ